MAIDDILKRRPEEGFNPVKTPSLPKVDKRGYIEKDGIRYKPKSIADKAKSKARKTAAKAGGSAALKGVGGKFLMGAGSQDDSGQGFRDRSTDDLRTLLEGSSPDSLQSRLQLSEIVKDAALSNPTNRPMAMSNELRSLLTPDTSDLISVAKKSKPSLKESYARAGLI